MLNDSDLDKDVHWNSFVTGIIDMNPSSLFLYLGGGNTYILLEPTVVVYLMNFGLSIT